MIKKISFTVIVVLLSSCAHKQEVWRNLTTDSPSVSIFIGYIETAKHILRTEQGELCPEVYEIGSNGEEIICFSGYRDPPPIKLTIKLKEHVYGIDLGSKFSANTTSHFGLNSFNIGEDQKYLMIVLSDGTTNILPRYHFDSVNERYIDSGSIIEDMKSYGLPLSDPKDEVYWLPCDSQALEKMVVQENKVGLWFSYARANEAISYDDEMFYRNATLKELIKEYKSLIVKDSRYHFKEGVLYKSVSAIPIKELKKKLKNYTQEQMLAAYDRETECK